jgi:hypothetical protein
VTNSDGTFTLSPMTDMSPLTFFALTPSVPCLISGGDSLTFTVKNQRQPANPAFAATVTVGSTPTGSGSLH